MGKQETLEEAAEKYDDYYSADGDTFLEDAFIAGAKWQQEAVKKFATDGAWQCPVSFEAGIIWQQEQHNSLYKSIRELRNELRDKYEDADLHEAGRLKQQVKGIDMILTKFEQLNIE